MELDASNLEQDDRIKYQHGRAWVDFAYAPSRYALTLIVEGKEVRVGSSTCVPTSGMLEVFGMAWRRAMAFVERNRLTEPPSGEGG